MTHRISRHAVVLIVAALMLMLSAGAGATAALMITGKQIKNGTVTGKDIKNRSLAAKDLSRAAKIKLRGRVGPAGPAGARGPAGPAGLSGFEVVTRTLPLTGVVPAVPVSGSVEGVCPAGKKALSATAGYAAPLNGLLSQVTRVSDTSFKATGLSGLLGTQTLTLDVVCAAIPS